MSTLVYLSIKPASSESAVWVLPTYANMRLLLDFVFKEGDCLNKRRQMAKLATIALFF